MEAGRLPLERSTDHMPITMPAHYAKKLGHYRDEYPSPRCHPAGGMLRAMADVRPAWAQRLSAERQARGWTQQQTVEALRMQSDHPLPGGEHLLRMWKNWERGKHRPRPDTSD